MPDTPGSSGAYAAPPFIPTASRRVAAHLSEQQSIVSALRELNVSIDAGADASALLCGAAFQELLLRMEASTQVQRVLLSESGELSSADYRTLLRQQLQIQEVLNLVMAKGGNKAEEPPWPCTAAAASSVGGGGGGGGSCGGGGVAAAVGGGRVSGLPPGDEHGSLSTLPASGQPEPLLIDFSEV